ncbi:uncharacterized protein C7orf50 homolog [Hydractinia symbiolongicarpus]|uniref:uncharacterized protein C7orf50 homolog n=1 Tax=Hydractinia symbiolongicarpus TaxID=13093 RepID=UPI00254CCE3E|nr:uncharacterized protein C7orf50 homolog [Hydractinia symbiolongicarpus]
MKRESEVLSIPVKNKKSKVTFEEQNNDGGKTTEHDTEYDKSVVNEMLKSAMEGKIKQVKQTNTKKREKKLEENSRHKEESNSTNPALKYLSTWYYDRKEWKFKKVRQTWLLQNAYDKGEVSKENFKMLLKYIEDMKGKSRSVTLENAQKIIEDDTETDRRKIKRATKIVKLLS